MNQRLPRLVAITSGWDEITESPVVGKDVLELLSSSMYVNALSIYREYVQNSVDAIEEAIGVGLLGDREKGRIDVYIDPVKRSVRVRDNGTGLPKSLFVNTLVNLGASRKRGSKARGFRGTGRLAGLGYCQELTFRSRGDSEDEVTELRWDCRLLKSRLRDHRFRAGVEALIRDVVRVRRYVSVDSPPRFFEVELSGIVRHGDDVLVNTQEIGRYLSQVAPVPFSPEFTFSEVINNALREKVAMANVLIYLNGDRAPLYRPHRDNFEIRKGVTDRFSEVEFFDLNGRNDAIAATGWILHHGYSGAIHQGALIKGLRLRSGNMQVGDSDVLSHLFRESRFNSWVVGEIHVLDERILPNGRRDHFEQSTYFNDLLNQLSPVAHELSRRCRISSIRRNVIREFETSRQRAVDNLHVIAQGAIPAAEQKGLERDLEKQLRGMAKACTHTVLEQPEKKRLARLLSNMRKRIAKTAGKRNEHKAIKRATGREKALLARVCSLIYECSPNKSAAKQLLDRVLAKL